MAFVLQREKGTIVSVHVPIYFFVFYLYKQLSSDNCVILENELTVTFSFP